jgi:6-phosphogluconolactonase
MGREVIRTWNFVADAANFIVDQANKAISERNEFRIALSGGNTPRPIYERLAIIRRGLPWESIRITFGDERCVPPDASQSNFRMAREALFIPAAIPEKSIMRMRGEDIYRHDLILLGLGDDGHTASLFPGTAGLEETTRRVIANFVPKFSSWRLTFTFPLINHARQICFLVNAKKGAELIERVLQGDPQLPATRVEPIAGDVTWIIGQSP